MRGIDLDPDYGHPLHVTETIDADYVRGAGPDVSTVVFHGEGALFRIVKNDSGLSREREQ